MFPLLFEPIKIGNVEVKNRIMMSPMATHYATPEGYVTERMKDYYAARAEGGVGVIVTESSYVHPDGKGGPNRMSICSDECIPGLKELTSAMHTYGAKVAVQLHHGGRQISPKAIGQYPASASSVLCQGWGVSTIPRTLKVSEIDELVEAYGEAARRAKVAGYDIVQIMAAHGYLLWSFLSPFANKRVDEYGGDLNGRMRFLQRIIERIREKIGNTPIMVRINGDDYLPEGITIEDSKAIAKCLEDVGVDAINVSAGTRESHEYQVPPRALPEGCNVHLAVEIKKVVGIPVSIAGRIRTPELAEKILEEKKVDIVELGRALIADPDFPRKAYEGRSEEIRRCISCIRCDERLFDNVDVKCTINLFAGDEGRYQIVPTDHPKKVLVVGGGPAGLEAARIAALRGHRVFLYEKDVALGGQLRVAAVPPYKGIFLEVIDYYRHQLQKLNVTVKLEHEVDLKTAESLKPDVVIVATGSSPTRPDVPGIDSKNVVTAWNVLAGKSNVGRKIVVVGCGNVGAETADLLSESRHDVTIIEMLEDIGLNVANTNGKVLLRRILERGVKIFINTRIMRVTKDGIIVSRAGKEEFIEADTVVLAAGAQSNRKLVDELKGKVPELYAVGDCVEPREAFEAIQEGLEIALKI